MLDQLQEMGVLPTSGCLRPVGSGRFIDDPRLLPQGSGWEFEGTTLSMGAGGLNLVTHWVWLRRRDVGGASTTTASPSQSRVGCTQTTSSGGVSQVDRA